MCNYPNLKNLKNHLLDSWLGKKIQWLIFHLSIPGFQGVPLFEVIRFIILEMRRDSLHTRAASIGFSFFLSFLPAIIFFFSLMSFFHLNTLETTLFEFLKDIMPRSAYFFVTDTIAEVNDRNPSTSAISLLFLLSFIFASNGMLSLMIAFKKRPGLIDKQRGFFKVRGLAFFLTILLAFVFIITLAAIIAGQYFINQGLELLTLNSKWAYFPVLLLKWIMTFFLVLNSISILYYFAPAVTNKWSYLSPGSILATILCISTSQLFSLYVKYFGKYSLLYGYIGTVMILMLWLYFNAFVILIGFEMNLGIDVKKKEVLVPEEN